MVDRAQAEIYDVTDRRMSDDFVALEDLLQPTMDEIDAIASQGGLARGVPTGFVELDDVTNGLHPGQMIIVAARPGVGKALALDTPCRRRWAGPRWAMSRSGICYSAPMASRRGGGGHRCHVGPAVLRGGVLRRDGHCRGCAAPMADRLWRPHHDRIALRRGQHRRGRVDGTLRQPGATATLMSPVLQIDAVRRVRSNPVRCVQVDNAARLYLAGRGMVPTHNSTLGLDFLRSCSIKNRLASVIFSLEMSKSEIVMRLLSAEAKIKLADMRSGRMSDDDWTRLARRMSEISEAPLYIDDSPNLTMMEIRAKRGGVRKRT